MFAGFATLRRVPRVRVLVGVIAVAGLVNGVADVLFVTFTDERLDGGGGQAGLLAAAFGLGGLVGAVAVTRLVHSTRIGGTLMGSAVLAAGALALMATTDGLVMAMLLFGMLGAGESVMLLTAAVTIQRQAPTDVLARVFGIVEGAQMGAIAVGGLLVTILVTRLTVSESFVVLGVIVLALVGVGVIRLARHGGDLPGRRRLGSSIVWWSTQCSLRCPLRPSNGSDEPSSAAACRQAAPSSCRVMSATTTS